MIIRLALSGARPLVTLALIATFVFSAPATVTAATQVDVARARAIEEAFCREGPSLKLSTVYDSMPIEHRVALMAKVKAMLLAHLPPDILEHPSIEGLPPDTQATVATALTFLKALSPEQIEAVVQKLDLDHLAPLPPSIFKLYHDRALGEPAPGSGQPRIQLVEEHRRTPDAWTQRARSTSGYFPATTARIEQVTILSAGDDVPPDEVPSDSIRPASIPPLVKASFFLTAPPSVLANSKRVAQAFNYLTDPSYRTKPLTVNVDGKSHEARSTVELFNALMASGQYDVALYDARMFVNFLGYSIEHGGQPVPIRMPTWAATSIDPAHPEDGTTAPQKPLIVPINHSEHLLVFFAKGTNEPAILVKWYMGIPDGAQGTLFKPAINKRDSWSGFRVVHLYTSLADIRKMVQAAGSLQQLFNFMQQTYQLRKNGYGVIAVCQDTTGLMEALLQGSSSQSTVWPLFRDPRLDFYYGAFLEKLGLELHDADQGQQLLDVPTDARPDRYPWIQDRRVELRRIGANIPTRSLETLHFPGLRQDLELMRDNSATFRRALEMQR